MLARMQSGSLQRYDIPNQTGGWTVEQWKKGKLAMPTKCVPASNGTHQPQKYGFRYEAEGADRAKYPIQKAPTLPAPRGSGAVQSQTHACAKWSARTEPNDCRNHKSYRRGPIHIRGRLESPSLRKAKALAWYPLFSAESSPDLFNHDGSGAETFMPFFRQYAA